MAKIVARCSSVAVAPGTIGMRLMAFMIHVHILRHSHNLFMPARRGHSFPTETRREDGDQHDEQHGT